MRDSEEGGTARTINDIYGDDARASEDGRPGMDLPRKGRARTELEGFAAVHADALLRSAYLMRGVPNCLRAKPIVLRLDGAVDGVKVIW
jgi:hypothetical protein